MSHPIHALSKTLRSSLKRVNKEIKDKEKLNRKISMLYNNFGKFIKNDDLKDPYKFIKNINENDILLPRYRIKFASKHNYSKQ